jgi:hypothetical protein
VKREKFFIGVTAAFFAAAAFCPFAMATEKGAKSLFYDPNAAGTVQIAQPNAEGGSGTFSPATTRMDANGNPVNQVSNYYENLNPGVMYWVELLRPGSGMVRRVSNDRVFRTGDQIRIHVTTNSQGYLHVLHTGTSGAAQIMPVSNAQNGAVQMGRDYVIPSNGGWLRFDGQPGQEKLKLVFASVKSSDNVVNVMRQVATQNASTATGQLYSLYNQYKNSPNYIQQVQGGSKDLMTVAAQTQGGYAQPAAPPQARQGYVQQRPAPQPQRYAPAPAPQPYYQPQPIQFNTQGMQNYNINPTVYNAPANYVVSQSQGAVKEPVVIEIALNHHP